MARFADGLRGMLRRSGGAAELPPFPARPVCVIGDVHGRADLLDRMATRIAARDPQRRARCILVGDLVDRGPDSAGVLRRAHALCRAELGRWLCLLGNHERMLLDFLDEPATHGPRWLANGGEVTAASFGLSLQHGRDRPAALARLAADLAAALGAELRDWLRGLPMLWQEGALVVSHAGIDPARPLAAQDADALLWGRRSGGTQGASAGFWVVQGHVARPAPVMRGRRILVDTGAWRSGRLTAAWLEAGQAAPEWLTVEAAPEGD